MGRHGYRRTLLVVRMSNVAISDEMAPALTLYRFGIIRPVKLLLYELHRVPAAGI